MFTKLKELGTKVWNWAKRVFTKERVAKVAANFAIGWAVGLFAHKVGMVVASFTTPLVGVVVSLWLILGYMDELSQLVVLFIACVLAVLSIPLHKFIQWRRFVNAKDVTPRYLGQGART